MGGAALIAYRDLNSSAAAPLGDPAAAVFTGAIGEKSPEARATGGLDGFGLALDVDAERNASIFGQ